jgi:hypothetical protein
MDSEADGSPSGASGFIRDARGRVHRRVPPEAWDVRMRALTKLSAYVFVRSRVGKFAVPRLEPEDPAPSLPSAA